VVQRKDEVFIHEKALCESDAIGSRTRIWAFAHVMPGARIGVDCNICDHVFIESGAIIGNRVTVKNNVLIWDKVTIDDDVFVGPNVVFTNDLTPRVAFKLSSEGFVATLVQRGASIGANATIVCGITIGRHAMIGAGSVVTRDVPSSGLVMGNPARLRGWVCECGRPLPDSLVCTCGRAYTHQASGLDSPVGGIHGLKLLR
jgi:UDP-2-acetamido-3-amino-2,3-dideoxy-glucuronate N-acetyltransferase